MVNMRLPWPYGFAIWNSGEGAVNNIVYCALKDLGVGSTAPKDMKLVS